jgi:hypothetical protein
MMTNIVVCVGHKQSILYNLRWIKAKDKLESIVCDQLTSLLGA